MNSVNTGWNDEDFSTIEKDLIKSQGIVDENADGSDLVVEENTPQQMNVLVNSGVAYVHITKNGRDWWVRVANDAQAQVTISPNVSGSTRIDALVLRVSVSTEPNASATNVATLVMVQGTPGGAAPSDGDITTALGSDGWLRLADITVDNGVGQIFTADIADARAGVNFGIGSAGVEVIYYGNGNNLTGVVHNPVDEDLLPDADDTRDLGSLLKKFQDLFLSGDANVDGDVYATYFRGDGTYLANVPGVEFDGTGADGALSITSGATNIDLSGERIVVKNYSSISITGTGSLTFSNPHNEGTVIILRCTGNVTINSTANPTIDLRGIGGAGGSGGNGGVGSAVNGANGTDASGNGVIFLATSFYGKLGGGGGLPADGNAGAAGSGGTKGTFYSIPFNEIVTMPGAGGAGGGGGEGGSYAPSTGGNGAAGGRGGGGLLMCIGGNFTFTAGTINASGSNGSNGTNGSNSPNTSGASGGGGGGGGGAAGFINVVVKGTVSNSGTFTVTGGSGGNGGTGSNGGNGAAGFDGAGGGGGGGGASYTTAGTNGSAGTAGGSSYGGARNGGSGGAGAAGYWQIIRPYFTN